MAPLAHYSPWGAGKGKKKKKKKWAHSSDTFAGVKSDMSQFCTKLPLHPISSTVDTTASISRGYVNQFIILYALLDGQSRRRREDSTLFL